MSSLMMFLLLAPTMANAPGELRLERCEAPFWLSITDTETGIERDFEGCGDGPLNWFPPEAMLLDADTFAAEGARYLELSAVLEGDRLVLSFRGSGDAQLQSARVGFGTSVAVGKRYRVIARPIRSADSVRIHGQLVGTRQVLTAVARLLEAELDAELEAELARIEMMDDQRVSWSYGRIEASMLLLMLGDLHDLHLQYLPNENRIRLQPSVGELQDPDLLATLERLRAVIDSGAAAEDLMASIHASLSAAPPQQVRISSLALAAMRIETEPSSLEAIALLRELDRRYFDFSIDVTAPEASPVDIFDERWILARKSITRAALRVAEDRLAREHWTDVDIALNLASATARDAELRQGILALRAEASIRKGRPPEQETEHSQEL